MAGVHIAARPSSPHRVTDGLAWLRSGLCDPEPNGLHPLTNGRALTAWAPYDDAIEQLCWLRDRGVLEAAGFLLFEDAAAHA